MSTLARARYRDVPADGRTCAKTAAMSQGPARHQPISAICGKTGGSNQDQRDITTTSGHHQGTAPNASGPKNGNTAADKSGTTRHQSRQRDLNREPSGSHHDQRDINHEKRDLRHDRRIEPGPERHPAR